MRINGNLSNSKFEYLSDMVSYKIHVFGKVQGVWYRASTKAKADELDVKGYVTNLEDGSVYIEASGLQSNIDSLISWCWNGPEYANVKDVKTEKIDLQNFIAFDIRRK